MKTLPLSKLKAGLGRICDIVERRDKVITITRRGKPVAVILSKNQYDGWQETVEIFKDADFMNEIRDGIRALKCSKKRHTIDELFCN